LLKPTLKPRSFNQSSLQLDTNSNTTKISKHTHAHELLQPSWPACHTGCVRFTSSVTGIDRVRSTRARAHDPPVRGYTLLYTMVDDGILYAIMLLSALLAQTVVRAVVGAGVTVAQVEVGAGAGDWELLAQLGARCVCVSVCVCVCVCVCVSSITKITKHASVRIRCKCAVNGDISMCIQA